MAASEAAGGMTGLSADLSAEVLMRALIGSALATSKPSGKGGELAARHARAMAAEFDGEHALARSRFGDCLAQAKIVYTTSDPGGAFPGAADPDAFARIFLTQGLAGASIALARGLDYGDPRCAYHLDLAAQFLALSPNEHSWSDWVERERVAAHAALGNLVDASRIAASALRRAPQNTFWHARTSELFLSRLGSMLRAGSDASAARYNADICERILADLAPLRQDHPNVLNLAEVEAECRRVLAIAFTNQDKISNGAREARLAMALDGASSPSIQTRNAIDEHARKVIAQISAAQAEIRNDPRRRLSDGAYTLKHEADDAVAILSRGDSSDEIALAARRETGIGRRVWRRIAGAEAPMGRDGDAQAVALLLLVERLPQQLEGAALTQAASDELAADPRMRGIDPAALTAFVGRLRSGEGIGPEPPQAEVEVVLPAPAALPPLRKRQREESLSEWWRSSRDGRLKAIAAAASAMIVLAVGAFGAQAAFVSQRNAAFATIVSTDVAANTRAVIAAAESYLTTPVWRPDRGREAAAISAYGEALRRRALATPDDPELGELRERYLRQRAAFDSRWGANR